MSPQDLARAAADAISRGHQRVQLVLPRGAGKSERMKALGGEPGVGIVWGELCCENAAGHAVVYVDALNLLAWLAVYAGVRVEVGGGE